MMCVFQFTKFHIINMEYSLDIFSSNNNVSSDIKKYDTTIFLKSLGSTVIAETTRSEMKSDLIALCCS